MAPLPQNNTGRYWVEYSVSGVVHELMVRYAAAVPLATTRSYINQFLQAIGPEMFATSVLSVRYSPPGTLVSIPDLWSGADTWGVDPNPPNRTPVQIRFEGRSAGGRRVSWGLYGWDGTIPDAFRFPIVAESNYDAAWQAILEARNDGVFVAIDGDPPGLKNYVNVNYNSYWERQQRG